MLQSLNFFHFLFIHTLHGFTEFTCQYSNNSGYSEFMSMGFEWVSKYISLMAGWHFLEAAVGRDSLIQQKMLRRMICLFLWWSNNTSLKSKWYSKKKNDQSHQNYAGMVGVSWCLPWKRFHTALLPRFLNLDHSHPTPKTIFDPQQRDLQPSQETCEMNKNNL